MKEKVASILILIFIILMSNPIFAQICCSTKGAFRGEVVDYNGTVIEGAEITFEYLLETTSNNKGKIVAKIFTDKSGQYISPLLKPGLYRLKVKVHKTITRQIIQSLELGHIFVQNFTLVPEHQTMFFNNNVDVKYKSTPKN